MSRWFQHIISVLYVDVEDSTELPFNADEPYLMTMDARLGYRQKKDDADKYIEIAHSMENRTVTCERISLREHEEEFHGEGLNFTDPSNHKDTILQCDILPLFELGSCHYDFYLVNIRIPVNDQKNVNTNLPKITDLHLVAIHQNGGFTKVWLSIKTFVFPVLMAVLIWFWKRIASLERPPRLIEKTLFALGLSLSFLNLPVEWMTLWFNMPFMLLLSDIRQGIFYSILLCFWIIFAGEHMMDQIERNRLVIYWRHLAGVVFGCICLFVFEMCERGVQMTNPFTTSGVTETGKRIGLGVLIPGRDFSLCLLFPSLGP
uniref:Wntless/Evi membrane protein n=1 Tax=Platynereis dumerilii TaxID=6359 RepID=I7KP41_PLADU|nr:Wntless/Evi membrane protein [Platynereis dumerilii]